MVRAWIFGYKLVREHILRGKEVIQREFERGVG